MWKKIINLQIQITNKDSIQINLFPVIFDHILTWPPLGKHFFWSICFLRTHSMAASAIVISEIEFCTKQCNKWRLYQKFYCINQILDISISFNSIYFLSLLHTFFNGFDHWFSWQLWHYKRKKCVTRAESLRGVGL